MSHDDFGLGLHDINNAGVYAIDSDDIGALAAAMRDAGLKVIRIDLEGVAVRSGQHCAHPLLQYYGVAATCRASLAFYNTHDEIERFVAALVKVRQLLG